MLRYILKRLIGSALVLVVIVTASFFIMRVAPGGPFDTDREMPEEVLQNIEAKYNLDKPLWQQYLLQMKSILLQGDFGPSMKYPNKSVNDILAEGLPVSMTLGVHSLLVALLIGLPAGLIAALKQNQWADYSAMTAAMVGVSIPNFVLGPILIAVFAIELPWFAAAGWNPLSAGVVPYLQTSTLPALALGSAYAAYVARLTRGGMLEIIRQDYIQTARAKGLREWLIVRRHALRGAFIPVVSYLGPAFAGMLTGSIVIEQIFNIPGLGSHFVNSAFNRDYPLVLGTIVLYSALLVVLNLLVDIAYTVLDPRVSYENE